MLRCPYSLRRGTRLLPFFRFPKKGNGAPGGARGWRGPFSGACEAPLRAHGHSWLPRVTACEARAPNDVGRCASRRSTPKCPKPLNLLSTLRHRINHRNTFLFNEKEV